VFDGLPPDSGVVKGEALVDIHRPDGVAVFGQKTGQPVGQLVSHQARLDARAVREALRPVLICPQLVLSAFVATDGLEDENKLGGLCDKLRRGPCREPEQVLASLKRPEGSDDLAVAYTHSRVAGMFGEIQLPTAETSAPAQTEGVSHV
jgi:hypothetical protein